MDIFLLDYYVSMLCLLHLMRLFLARLTVLFHLATLTPDFGFASSSAVSLEVKSCSSGGGFAVRPLLPERRSKVSFPLLLLLSSLLYVSFALRLLLPQKNTVNQTTQRPHLRLWKNFLNRLNGIVAARPWRGNGTLVGRSKRRVLIDFDTERHFS